MAYDHDGCEAVHPEGQQDESGGVGQIRAESAGQDEVTDADRDEDRPQDDAGPGESVLQPAVGSPEVPVMATRPSSATMSQSAGTQANPPQTSNTK